MHIPIQDCHPINSRVVLQQMQGGRSTEVEDAETHGGFPLSVVPWRTCEGKPRVPGVESVVRRGHPCGHGQQECVIGCICNIRFAIKILPFGATSLRILKSLQLVRAVFDCIDKVFAVSQDGSFSGGCQGGLVCWWCQHLSSHRLQVTILEKLYNGVQPPLVLGMVSSHHTVLSRDNWVSEQTNDGACCGHQRKGRLLRLAITSMHRHVTL
mmetsp:Transcript_61445/g.109497  ORF Transcript_61445/g.109497 Transcript_61445/m.109497 type:complete len:211 (+) Transcript_61445:1345-1977(+)